MNLKLEHLAADLFGLPPFSKHLLSCKEPVLGVIVPRTPTNVTPSANRFDRDERAALTSQLTASLAPYAPHVAVLDSIRSLEQPSATVALATARPGLFGSTLDALYAALHAIRIAQALSQVDKRDIVPLLWIDTDTEPTRASYEATFHSSDYLPQRVQLPTEHDAEKTRAVRACLAQLLGHEPSLESALELLTPREGEHVATALTRSLLELLGSTGLLVCSANDFREDVSHFLAQIIAADPEPSIQHSRDELAALDFTREAHALDPTLVQRVTNQTTQPLHSGGDGFCYADEPGSRTNAELAAEIVQSPHDFVPGQTLLPLVQDLTLPIAIRIVPRESLYGEAVLDALRASLDAPRVPVVPRLSCTLVDPATRESLEKLELTAREVCAAGALLEDPGRAARLRGALDEFRALSDEATEKLHRIARPLWEFDPVLRPVARRSARDVRRALDRLCEKAENVLGTRGGQFDRHQRRVNAALVPNGSPQESVEYLLTWLAPNGPTWILELLDELDPFAWEHLVVNFP